MQNSMISKAISLLSLIGQARRPMSFTDLVKQSDLSKSTVHRILGILIEEEMVRYHDSAKSYLLGRKSFEIMKQAYTGYDLQALAVDGMVALQAETGHNISLGVVDGDHVVVLRAFDAGDRFGGHQRPGLREPLHVCAAGKALVAYLSPSLFEAKFDGYDFFSRSPQTITSLDAFRKDLAQVRARGYATCDREEYDYISGIAAPIFNYVGEAIASVNVWNTVEEATLADLETYADALIQMTSAVTDLIGGMPVAGSADVLHSGG